MENLKNNLFLTNKLILAILLITFNVSNIFSQEQKKNNQEVTYLSKAPKIDGRLDESLKTLPIRNFPISQKSNFSINVPPASYRLAYGIDFLYLYIEVESNDIQYRERAFQFGDGFHLLIAKALPDSDPTSDFYVLGGSAVNEQRLEWTRKIFWYHNKDVFKKVSDKTKMEFNSGKNKIGFELLLPWREVHPYHPWLMKDGIGFNLVFVKAIGKKDRIKYRVFPSSLGGNRPRRYQVLKFEKPVHSGKAKSFVQLSKNHIKAGENIDLTAVTIASKSGNENIYFSYKTGEGHIYAEDQLKYEYQKGQTIKKLSLSELILPVGGYNIELQSSSTELKGQNYLTVFSPLNPEKLNKKIIALKSKISLDSIFSLQFSIEEIQKTLKSLKTYDTAATVRLEIDQLKKHINQSENGNDIIREKKGFLRKAYRSKIDNTLQPYTVNLPEAYVSSKKYPLIVFLHGSESSEKNLQYARKMFPLKKFILLGPKGRGLSNYFTKDNAQKDISEAIEAVKRSYNIDSKNIFLSGFSMGGYGVLRTYFETPKKFKGLIINSGTPFATKRFNRNNECPNFLEDKYLSKFKNIEMIVFHGDQDRNIPIERVEKMVDVLKKHGATVEFKKIIGKGHEMISGEAKNILHKWLTKQLN